MSIPSQVCVRPEWRSAPLSARALELLVKEWRSLGLLDDGENDTDPEKLLEGVQKRAGSVPGAPPGRPQHLRLVTTADGPADAPEAAWPVMEGTLLRYGETAIVGADHGGRFVRERFLPGSVVMPDDGQVLLNRNHERNRVIGHVQRVSDEGGDVRVRARLVDTVRDGQEAAELIRSESVRALSIEFMPLGEPNSKITHDRDGGRLIEHSRVMLVGVGVVPVPAYRSGRVSRLLDRAEAGREREAARRKAIAHLESMGA